MSAMCYVMQIRKAKCTFYEIHHGAVICKVLFCVLNKGGPHSCFTFLLFKGAVGAIIPSKVDMDIRNISSKNFTRRGSLEILTCPL